MVSYREGFCPAYSLGDIQAAAEQCQIRYEGRKVNWDIRNLGYTLEDVARCIAGLRAEHFRKTLGYPDATYDVYVRRFRRSEDLPCDELYIKLRLLATGELMIGLGSFHL